MTFPAYRMVIYGAAGNVGETPVSFVLSVATVPDSEGRPRTMTLQVGHRFADGGDNEPLTPEQARVVGQVLRIAALDVEETYGESQT